MTAEKDKYGFEYVKLNKLSQAQSRTISIRVTDIREAGFDPSKELKAKRIPKKDGRIILKLKEED